MKSNVRILLFLFLSLSVPELIAADSVGINTHLPSNDVCDAVAAAGIPWIRIDVNWLDVEPQSGKFNWGEVDRVVNVALSQNLRIFATFAYTPLWASSGNIDGKSSGNDVPRSGLYERALKEAVKRYRGKIAYWGLWNEPNLSEFWEGTADQYVNLIVLPGSATIRQECPECLVLGPELANVGDTLNNFYDVIFSRAGKMFDIITHHIYQTFPQLDPWAGYTSDSFFNALEKRRVFSTRMALYEALSKHNLTSKEVWITETGYRCQPPTDQSEMSNQRLYYELVLKAQMERAWWTNTFFYEIEDCGIYIPNCHTDGYGILRRTAGPDNTYQDNFLFKPAYSFLKDFLIQHPEFRDGTQKDAGYQDTSSSDTYEDDGGVSDTGGQATKIIKVRRAQQRPVIDGNIDDFYTSEGVILTTKDYIRITTESNGDNDISGRFYFMWDNDNLYIGAIIRDDINFNKEQPMDLWRGDSIQIAFDADYDRTVGSYDDDGDYEMGFGVVNNSISTYRWVSPISAKMLNVVTAFKRSGAELTYEISIPFDNLTPFYGQIGERGGISFLVNDNDGNGREGFIQFTSGIGIGKNPSAFGEILLAGGVCEVEMECSSKQECLRVDPLCKCPGEWSCNGRGMCEWICSSLDAGYDVVTLDISSDVAVDIHTEGNYYDEGLSDIVLQDDIKTYLSCGVGLCVETECPQEYPLKTERSCLTPNNTDGFCCIPDGDVSINLDDVNSPDRSGENNVKSGGCSCSTLF